MRRAMIFAALLLAAAPASAQAFSKAIWGPVSRHGVSQFPLYRQLGVRIYETKLNWSFVAPTRPADPADPADPAYAWPAELDQAVTQAQQFHMRVLIQITGTPAWANGGHADWGWAPQNPRDFATFARAAARRYPSVHMWMVWGEPTRPGSFNPMPAVKWGRHLDRTQRLAPHRYAQMLDAAYVALKGLSRRNLVIGGSTYSAGLIHPYQWIRNLRLPNGKPPRMDLYAHNPFGDRAPSFSDPPTPQGLAEFPDLPRLARTIDRHLRRGIRLFISEWTIPTAADEELPFWVDPPVAARWVRTALRLTRRWHRIFALGWIHLYDSPPFSYGGLLTDQGRKKPTFYAFARG